MIFCTCICKGDIVNAEYNDWSKTGDNFKEQGYYAKAISAYDKALDANPNDKEILVNMEDSLNLLGNHAKTISAYDKALEIHYDYVNAWDGKSGALDELGDYTQAITYFDRTLQIIPTLVDSLFSKEGRHMALAIIRVQNILSVKHLQRVPITNS